MSKNIEVRKQEKGSKETLALRFDFIQPNISGLEGKVLTIIDASIIGKQGDAIKGLIKQEFRKTIDWLYDVSCSDLSNAKKIYPKYGRPFPEQTVEINQ